MCFSESEVAEEYIRPIDIPQNRQEAIDKIISKILSEATGGDAKNKISYFYAKIRILKLRSL